MPAIIPTIDVLAIRTVLDKIYELLYSTINHNPYYRQAIEKSKYLEDLKDEIQNNMDILKSQRKSIKCQKEKIDFNYDVLSKKIIDVNYEMTAFRVPVRVLNCLSAENIVLVKDLTRKSIKEIQGLGGIGKEGVSAIVIFLSSLGLSLKLDKEGI